MTAAAVVDTKRICSHCLRGQHDECTVPDKCGCPTCNPPGVLWEDPPPRSQRGRRRQIPEHIESALRANAGRWARVREYPGATSANTAANALRKGRWEQWGIKSVDWEAQPCRTDKGSVLYLRYVGKDGGK